jgi:hypothetical protein
MDKGVLANVRPHGYGGRLGPSFPAEPDAMYVSQVEGQNTMEETDRVGSGLVLDGRLLLLVTVKATIHAPKQEEELRSCLECIPLSDLKVSIEAAHHGTPSISETREWKITISPGHAVDPWGNEITIPVASTDYGYNRRSPRGRYRIRPQVALCTC